MSKIHVLSKETIDLISAGEVVERPFNVVKELVENAIDAGATAITVEIKDGGLSLIRVTDNGEGISADDVRTAFYSHATSKISTADDLNNIESLGFRGEALSSIAAVSSCEVITKTASSLTGTRFLIEGGNEQLFEEIGAPDGTTFLVRELFYNVPARKKFLKSNQSEGSHIGDLMEHIAMSRPDIAVSFISSGRSVFSTSGNGNLKDVIYRIYGREITDRLIEIHDENDIVRIDGYLAKPEINRGSRGGENLFLNGRYITCDVLQKALEAGYEGFLMLHKFPFAVLHFTIDPSLADVNVHPAKLTAKLTHAEEIYRFVSETVNRALSHKELIPDVILTEAEKAPDAKKAPEPFEFQRIQKEQEEESEKPAAERSTKRISLDYIFGLSEEDKNDSPVIKKEDQIIPKDISQMNLFEEEFLTEDARKKYEILGQIFKTYWLIVFEDKLYIMDQHAAHEKVKYERILASYREQRPASQSVNPPAVLDLTVKEMHTVKEYLDNFRALGFEIEDFGLNSIAIRAVPTDLYGCDELTLFREILEELMENPLKGDYEVVLSKLASMSCKAAVKGNNTLTFDEAGALLDELLTLDNPYNCPHGRPTIVSMSKYEIEKKFKRIVN